MASKCKENNANCLAFYVLNTAKSGGWESAIRCAYGGVCKTCGAIAQFVPITEEDNEHGSVRIYTPDGDLTKSIHPKRKWI